MKINEAVYNKGSPITFFSEYQIRENGFVLDSVAEKHMKALRVPGSQQLVLNDVLHVPFIDKRGIMGFEILPIEEKEIDEIDLKFDIFEITSDAQWIPAQFCYSLKAYQTEALNKANDNDSHVYNSITSKSIFFNYMNHSSSPALLFIYATTRFCNCNYVCPWHRVDHQCIDLTFICCFLG